MPLDGCCFYRVVDGRPIADHLILQALSPYWLEKYSSYYWRHDPLHPARTADPEVRVRSIGGPDRSQCRATREYAAGFLAPQKTMFQTELYFRHQSRIVAGASLLRSGERGAFTAGEVRLLEEVIDFSGGGPQPVGGSGAAPEAQRWLAGFRLPPKEHEIALLMGQALTNKEISRRLDIALPTVKTHVGRVLEKCGSANRNVFLHRFLNAEGDQARPAPAD